MAELISKIYQNKDKILAKYLEKLSSLSDYNFFFGSELEFYLTPIHFLKDKSKNTLPTHFSSQQIKQIFFQFHQSFFDCYKIADSLIYCLEEEKGENQFELKFSPTCHILKLSNQIKLAKETLIKIAKNYDLTTDFSAIPNPQDCSNSLQISISIKDLTALGDKNILSENQNLVKNLVSAIMENCYQGLIFLSPNQNDYHRFDLSYNLALFKSGKFTAPINFSYGINNRSCGIRIVKKANNFERLEVRFAAANCDVDLFLAILVKAIIEAMDKNFVAKKFNNLAPIYGNAFESEIVNKYQLELISQSFLQAEKIFLASDLLNDLEKIY